MASDKELLDGIIKAWVDKGGHPLYHDRVQRKVKSEWPTLANAIEKAIRERGYGGWTPGSRR